MDRAELERLDRESLVARAHAAGIRRARLLTRPELVDELLRIDLALDPRSLKKSRGFFGLARDLLSRVVERGLHLPDAADRLRAALGTEFAQIPRPEPQAVPTVTLAEIYAAQGHRDRAIETLLRVLETEPEHGPARALLERLEALDYIAPPPVMPPEPDEPRDEIGAHLGTNAEPPSEPLSSTPRVEIRALPADPECVAIPLPDGGTYVWWRLPENALDRSSFVVRVLALVPTWDGPLRETRDLPLDPTLGELILRDLPDRAIVRVAVGTNAEGDFVPYAHSPALELSASHDLLQWTPDGTFPVGADDPHAASISLAAKAAERALSVSH
jgi:hypothetical protein